MSDTPETDAESFSTVFQGELVKADFARRLERERDEARKRVKELIHENETLYRRLEPVHEVYRLLSMCRTLKAENEQLKQQQP